MRVPYVRIVTDDAGETHFEDAATDLVPGEFAPPAPPLGLSDTVPSEGVLFIGAPVGWDSPPHPAPRRQWVVMVRGTVETTTSDGETRAFGPGAAVLVEDTHGKGHRTRVAGAEPWLAIVVVLPGAPSPHYP
jgi:hypothetical protein